VIPANLIPAAPFVILVMTPFIEQIDPNSNRPRVFGASTGRMFWHALVPLLGRNPRRVAPRAGAHDRLFELTFSPRARIRKRWSS
jgi:hypothetical protein